VIQVIIPSSITYIISWTFIRFEINFAVPGAGGIGFDMFMASGFYFDLSVKWINHLFYPDHRNLS
jgi:phosphonate transport system permease protein